MEIKLKKLKLEYFKGIKNLEIDFLDENVSNVMGRNGAGKSSVMDSYTWLFWGNDSHGRSDSSFSIKTFDKDNNVIQKVEHSVEGTLLIDGEENVFKRTLREKWVKKRGTLETEFTGNETVYEINDVPKKKSEYDARISQIVSEDVFKLLSNPLEFNSLHWEKQRSILIGIVGEVSETEIAKGNDKFEALLHKLSNKDLDEYKSELAAKRKKLNDEIKFLPVRIDEVEKGKPEPSNFKEAEEKKVIIQKQIDKVDSEIQDRNKAIDARSKKRQELSDEKFKLMSDNKDIEFETRKNLKENSEEDKLADIDRIFNIKVSDRASFETGIQRLQKDLTVQESELKQTTAQLVRLRKDWDAENAKEFKFDESGFNCPACKRPLEAENIEEEKNKLEIQFNQSKASNLKRLNEQGPVLAEKEKSLKESIVKIESRIQDGKKHLESVQSEINELESKIKDKKSTTKDAVTIEQAVQDVLSQHKTYQHNLKGIKAIEASLESDTGFDISDLQEKKTSLNNDLQELNNILQEQVKIDEANNRIKEIADKESVYAQQIADLEREQFTVQAFVTAKINEVEDRVNKLFPNIKWKMFETQVNGGIADTCIATFGGVNFADLNTAGKIKAGIEIINVLCNYYKVYCPIWIDNSESISEIPPSKSQQVRLYVNDGYSKLTVQ